MCHSSFNKDLLKTLAYVFIIWSSGIIIGVSFGIDEISEVKRDLSLYSKITIDDQTYSCSISKAGGDF